jgi:hypothetical protein
MSLVSVSFTLGEKSRLASLQTNKELINIITVIKEKCIVSNPNLQISLNPRALSLHGYRSTKIDFSTKRTTCKMKTRNIVTEI